MAGPTRAVTHVSLVLSCVLPRRPRGTSRWSHSWAESHDEFPRDHRGEQTAHRPDVPLALGLLNSATCDMVLLRSVLQVPMGAQSTVSFF